MFADAHIVASDVSKEALKVAEINVTRHQMQQRVALRQSDVYANIEGCFDLIISNPPYVDQHDMAQLPAEFKHEPALGLAAGENGLAIVDTILAQAHRYLSPAGLLVVEVGNSAQALEEKYPQLPFFWPEFANGGEGVFVLQANQLQQINCSKSSYKALSPLLAY